MTTTEFFNQYGYFVGEFPEDCVVECSAAGEVKGAVEYWTGKLGFEVPRERAINYLAEFGAWSHAELNEMNDTDLAEKVLWLACCDIKENGEWFGLVH